MKKIKTRKHSYAYIATTTDGKQFSINAPNSVVARTKALAVEQTVETLERVFKRGGDLGRQVMKKSDLLAQL
jgi:hypothetical protein